MDRCLIRIVAIALLLGACRSSDSGYYSTPIVTGIKETGAHRAAAIVFSDPQVFSRESLLNQRLAELDYLQKQLSDSVTQTFAPQLHRDLSAISVLTAQLGIAFNPTLGATTQRGQDVAELQHKIDVNTLRAKLLQVERQLQDLVQDPKKTVETKSDSPSSTTPPKAAEVPKPHDVSELLTSTRKVLDAMADELKRARASAVVTSPEDTFHALQAFRSEIHADLAGANLDEKHDAAGNTLYRLHFRATVSPPARPDDRSRWGLARFHVLPPRLNAREIDNLYSRWLLHMVERMNSFEAGTREKARFHPAYTYRALELAGFFEIHPVTITLDDGTACRATGAKETPERCRMVFVAVPPGSDKDDRDKHVSRALAFLATRGSIPEDARADFERGQRIRLRTAPPQPIGAVVTPGRFKALIQYEANTVFANGNSFSYATFPAQREQRLSTVASAANTTQLALALSAALPVKGLGADAAVSHLNSIAGKIDAIERTPLVVGFTDQHDLLRYPKSGAKDSKRAEPAPAVATPLAHEPRSSRCRYFGLDCPKPAAKASAGIPLPPEPIVHPHATFGWIFGPRLVANPSTKSLDFLQSVATHPVAVDLSVPGWWPRIELALQTFWVGNWRAGDQDTLRNDVIAVLGDDETDGALATRTVNVTLPVRVEGLDGLTKLASREAGLVDLNAVFITKLEPQMISGCAQDVTILVYGSNLWRNPELFLNGVRHSQVRALPDMQALAATFRLGSQLAGSLDPSRTAQLRVFTSGGEGVRSIGVTDVDDRGNCVRPDGAQALEVRATASRFTPSDKVTVEVASGSLKGAMFAFRVGIRPKTAAGTFDWTDSKPVKPALDDKSVTGEVGALPIPDDSAGVPVEAALRLQDRENSAVRTIVAPTPMVYYPNAQATKVRPKAASVDSLDRVTLVLPKNSAIGFPDLAVPGLVVKASTGSGTDVISVVATPPRQAFGDEWTLTFRPATDEDKKKLDEAHRKGRLKFSLSFDGAAGRDLPSIDGDVTLEKRK